MSLHEQIQKSIARYNADGVKLSNRSVYGSDNLKNAFAELVDWTWIGARTVKIIPLKGVSITWLGEEGSDVLESPEQHVYYAIHTESKCVFVRVEYDELHGRDDMVRVLQRVPDYMLERLK
jgi:hypothetical protein